MYVDWIIKTKKRLINRNDEEKKFLKLMIPVKKSARILDVGCGYGRNMRLLKRAGYKNVVGVDKNNKIIKENIKKGLNCVEVDKFLNRDSKELYDCIIMSHIIEHFEYNDLKKFMECYLKYLKRGGYLIIITPLYTKSFYDDFDHVKPYSIVGFNMVFGNKNSQVQFYSDFTLTLEDMYFRRGPYEIKFSRQLYIPNKNLILWSVINLINIVFVVLYKYSNTFIGNNTGWLARYRKE